MVRRRRAARTRIFAFPGKPASSSSSSLGMEVNISEMHVQQPVVLEKNNKMFNYSVRGLQWAFTVIDLSTAFLVTVLPFAGMTLIFKAIMPCQI